MTQKRRKTDSGKAIGETTALRWEPTHVTKPNPRVVPLQEAGKGPPETNAVSSATSGLSGIAMTERMTGEDSENGTYLGRGRSFSKMAAESV